MDAGVAEVAEAGEVAVVVEEEEAGADDKWQLGVQRWTIRVKILLV